MSNGGAKLQSPSVITRQIEFLMPPEESRGITTWSDALARQRSNLSLALPHLGCNSHGLELFNHLSRLEKHDRYLEMGEILLMARGMAKLLYIVICNYIYIYDYICIYDYMYIQYIYIYTYDYVYIYIYDYVYIYIYICIYVYIYRYVCVNKLNGFKAPNMAISEQRCIALFRCSFFHWESCSPNETHWFLLPSGYPLVT